MKKFNLKNKLLIALFTFVICAVFSCSFFTKKEVVTEQVNANYVDSNIYIDKLISQTNSLESSYSLSSYYPIFPENQTDSNLCWIYSSMKTLETSLMVQKNEYHNFSEIGTALLYYLNYTVQNSDISSDMKVIDKASNFAQFNLVAKNYGLIYENVLSNDVYLDVDESSIYLYNEQLATANTEILENVDAINIADDTTFISLERQGKIDILKKYILSYGGIFAGIERGVISNSIYYNGNINADSLNDSAVKTDHAICIVGWDDNKDCGKGGTGAFQVLNSWGVAKNSYSYFYVPYSYDHIYEDAYGYICLDEDFEDYIQVSSTAGGSDGFTNKYMNTSSINPNNMFLYGENFELVYEIANNLNFDSIFVNIYQGNSNVTSDFLLEFDDNNNRIKITIDNSSKVSEGYYIEFYEDSEFLGSEDFYIFSGTEMSYVEFKDASQDNKLDSVLFNNNFASGNFSQTYYLYDDSAYDYYLDFYLPGLSGYNFSKVDLSVGKIYITSTDANGVITTREKDSSDYISVSIEPVQQITIPNRYRVKIAELIRKNVGKMVEFDIEVYSNKNVGTGKATNYNFKFFISSYEYAQTGVANKIIYNLNGGENNPENINRYPMYDKETTNMTSFTLSKPTKNNASFIGWYLDKDFTVEISEISSNIPSLLGKKYDNTLGYYVSSLLGKKYSDDIVIYARWEEADLDFFDGEINISGITDYDGNSKSLTSSIIYGDSVRSTFNFLPHLETLKNYKYFANYTYYFNGNLIESSLLNSSGDDVEFANNFLSLSNKPELVVGNYQIKVKVVMVISHQFSINKEFSLSYSVGKKIITATFDENTLNYVYDSKGHKPTLLSLNGIYAEDGTVGYTIDRDTEKNSGTYTYNVISIDNKNYELAPNQSCEMTITPAEITLEWTKLTTTYNGLKQKPEYMLNGVYDGDIIEVFYGLKSNLSVEPELKNAGTYELAIKKISNSNYNLIGNTDCVFNIEKANIKIIFNNIEARFTLAPKNRPRITWKVEGTLYDNESALNISGDSRGLIALESGEYTITGTYSNSNYEAKIVEGIYKILGYYYVFYKLPDGSEYRETVEDGQAPMGVPKEVLSPSLFHKIEYSQELVGSEGTDLYIDVTMKNYTWIVVIVAGILFLIILYRISTRKARRNRVR